MFFDAWFLEAWLLSAHLHLEQQGVFLLASFPPPRAPAHSLVYTLVYKSRFPGSVGLAVSGRMDGPQQ